ncbi:3-hydroxyisobutyrate dehydrogenase [Agilicoccus flavus]|uniref:3-hydroxyisobutyrate dehydrogenase n=1 Tax=Agilicoccus flavus TaxID=2775968 RepID=UPI001CF66582|nr:3-hydroxyisobutyrate dehydrogenase [Agilicoccus flavus]
MTTVAWIGLGNMGSRMATHLISAGHTVRGYDVSPQATSAAQEAGLQVAGSIAEAVDGADVVVTMVPKGDHARAVYLGSDGEQGVFDHAAPGAVLIDSSTIDVATAQELHDEAARRGLAFVDAPVSGGISGAAAGTLTFMVGGLPENVDQAVPYLEPMAGNVIPTGGPTTGQAAKICNNLMLGINIAAMSEGAVLADRLGLDRKLFWDIARVSSGDSWALRTWYPMPGIVEGAASNSDFAATFSTALMHKDLGLALAAAEQTGTPLDFGALMAERLQQITDAGYGDKDCTAVVKIVDGTLTAQSPDAQNGTAP